MKDHLLAWLYYAEEITLVYWGIRLLLSGVDWLLAEKWQQISAEYGKRTIDRP
jgi:hypothetical protein